MMWRIMQIVESLSTEAEGRWRREADKSLRKTAFFICPLCIQHLFSQLRLCKLWFQHKKPEAVLLLVCYTAVFSVVTQCSSPEGALRDDTKNGCVADYIIVWSIQCVVSHILQHFPEFNLEL